MYSSRGGQRSKRTMYLIILLLMVIQVITIVGLATDSTSSTNDGSMDSPLTNVFADNTGEDDSSGSTTTTTTENVLVIEEKQTPAADINVDDTSEQEAGSLTTSNTNQPSTTTPDGEETTSTTTPVTEPTEEVAEEPAMEEEASIKEHYDITVTQAKRTLTIIAPPTITSGEEIQIKVTTNDDEPLEDVTVLLFGEATTDAEGKATFTVPTTAQGKYIANAVKDDYQNTYTVIKVESKGTGAPFIQQPEDISDLLNLKNNMRRFLLNRILLLM